MENFKIFNIYFPSFSTLHGKQNTRHRLKNKQNFSRKFRKQKHINWIEKTKKLITCVLSKFMYKFFLKLPQKSEELHMQIPLLLTSLQHRSNSMVLIHVKKKKKLCIYRFVQNVEWTNVPSYCEKTQNVNINHFTVTDFLFSKTSLWQNWIFLGQLVFIK